jgi:hypothetical protein
VWVGGLAWALWSERGVRGQGGGLKIALLGARLKLKLPARGVLPALEVSNVLVRG